MFFCDIGENKIKYRFLLEVFEDQKVRGLEFVHFLVIPYHKNINSFLKSHIMVQI